MKEESTKLLYGSQLISATRKYVGKFSEPTMTWLDLLKWLGTMTLLFSILALFSGLISGMKAVKIDLAKDTFTITTETSRTFRKPKIRIFVSREEMPKGYWRWTELPDNNPVDTGLSFQLDTWARIYKAGDVQ